MNIQTIGLIDDDDILIDIAALALSQLDHGDADLEAHLDYLNGIEERICAEGKSAFLSSERAMVLAEVLHGEQGFRGDPDGYDAPVNADFIRVLDRRRGLPIALAVLYVAMARRAGWAADVLNVPGHVLVQVGTQSPVIIDPFMGGRMVSRDELQKICQFYTGERGAEVAQFVAPMTNRQILARLLSNQAARANNEGDLQRAMIVYDRIIQIAPDTFDAWKNLTHLYLVTNQQGQARECLLAMTELTKDEAVRRLLLEAFRKLDPAGSQAA